jgi:SAM-dependent methyltransferase
MSARARRPLRGAGRLALRRGASASRRAAAGLSGLEAALGGPDVLLHEQDLAVRAAMGAHDMVASPDELYYRDRYWAWIEGELAARDADRSGTFLDAGCGSGRLTLPLARQLEPRGGSVVGVDLIGESVAAAREGARAAGLANAEFREADLPGFLEEEPDARYEGALFLEVSIQLLDVEGVLRQLHRVLRPGGLLLASFRSRCYLAQLAAARRNWEQARIVMSSWSGALPGLGVQAWQNGEEIRRLLDRTGFAEPALSGVGLCSGIEGDPLAALALPSELGAGELDELAAVEAGLAEEAPDAGRYVLAATVKTG